MDKLFGFLKKEKVSSRSKLEIPKFTPAEIKEIQQNIETFKNAEAKQYIIGTLKKHKELETQFEGLQDLGAPNRRQGSTDSPNAAKKIVLGGSGSGPLTVSVEKVLNTQKEVAAPAETKVTNEKINTVPPGPASTKPRPTAGGSGGSFKRVDNAQVQTITKKESLNQVINLNARIDGSNPKVAATKEDINAALKALDPSFKEPEVEDEVSEIGDGFSTVRIKPDEEDEDAYGTVRFKGGDDMYGTVRISDDDDDSCGTVRMNKVSQSEDKTVQLAKGFSYREPEIWEQNIIALTRGEWAEGMTEEAFKRWKGKERGALVDVFSQS